MADLALIAIPNVSGQFLQVSNVPIIVEENSIFTEAIELRDKLLSEGESLCVKISSDEEFEKAGRLLQIFKRFLKYADDGTDRANDDINAAKNLVMASRHKLKDGIESAAKQISKSHGIYKTWREEQIRLENERLAREAEAKRLKDQHEADIEVLRAEIQMAQQTAQEASGRNQPDTANEINTNLKQLITALKVPQSIHNPIEAGTQVRQLVALAIQHEQARIAAAQAKAEGDKKAAAAILKASAKLEAPVVEEVVQRRVEAAPVVARKPELFHAKGASVVRAWRVKTIYDPSRVCREHPELCEPSISRLNDLAKRLQQKPNIPGVDWDEDIRTRGVR